MATINPVRPENPRWVLDTALTTSVAGAAFFVIGHLVHVRDARKLGIPAHLLPEVSIEQKILVGGLHIFWLALVCILAYFLALLFVRLAPRPAGHIKAYCLKRFEAHTTVYRVLGLVLATAAVILSVFSTPILLGSWPYSDERLPRVVTLTLKKEAKGPVECDGQDPHDLLYISHRDKCFVLKCAGRPHFLILKEDDVTELRLEGRSMDDFISVRGVR